MQNKFSFPSRRETGGFVLIRTYLVGATRLGRIKTHPGKMA